MPAGLTTAIVVNYALEEIAAQTRITALTDGSPAANQANVVYAPVVQLMLRELDPDFARYTVALTTQSGASLPPPWTFEYQYPADCVRMRQVRPPASGPGSLADPFDPQPVAANVAMDLISSAPTKVILTNQQNAWGVYTTSLVTEVQWDAAFTDAVVRRLANPLAMAIAGRPDYAKAILETSAMMAQTCELIDDSGFRRGPTGV